jgi:hypothetical protein
VLRRVRRSGCRGEITAEQFRRVFTGHDPRSGELLGWRHRKDGVLAYDQAHTVDAPGWLTDLLGPTPDSILGRRVWRRAAEQIESYRDRYGIQTDGLGERPDDLASGVRGGTVNNSSPV